jgi:ferric-dicitrate binding protein FerR (iron transport regulator)
VWLKEHPEADASEMEAIWRLTEEAVPYGSDYVPDGDRAAEMRRNILERVGSTVVHQDRQRTRFFVLRPAWAVAASILVAALIGTIFLSQPVTVTAPVGELTRVVLPDESEVLLNSGSTLARSRTFGWWGRSVELEGEAFFDVMTASNPFDVQTFNGSVSVLGTHFNVRAWPTEGEPETQVILTEGSVRFSEPGDPERGVVLGAGQMSRISGAGGLPTKPVAVDAKRFLIWRTGGLAFFDATIGTVLDDIERRFGIEVTAPARIRVQRVSLSMTEVRDVAAVLDVLAGTHGLSWTREGEQYRVNDSG